MSTQCQLSEPYEPNELSAWNPAQQAMLRALADGASKSDAARVANVHRSTINNWERSSAEFRDAVLAAQAVYRETLANQIRRIAAKSLTVLEALLDDPKTPAAVRLRAIQFVLNRPRFPQKEWALPESLHDPAMQKVEESMAIIEADYIASRQYDAIRKNDVENVESLRNHFPVSRHLPMEPLSASEPTNTTKTRNTVENVECVEGVESIKPAESAENVESAALSPLPTPRSARCPCGSGLKYKRCCGTNAPPVLNRAAPGMAKAA